jgi:hypothetical protein
MGWSLADVAYGFIKTTQQEFAAVYSSSFLADAHKEPA